MNLSLFSSLRWLMYCPPVFFNIISILVLSNTGPHSCWKSCAFHHWHSDMPIKKVTDIQGEFNASWLKDRHSCSLFFPLIWMWYLFLLLNMYWNMGCCQNTWCFSQFLYPVLQIHCISNLHIMKMCCYENFDGQKSARLFILDVQSCFKSSTYRRKYIKHIKLSIYFNWLTEF